MRPILLSFFSFVSALVFPQIVHATTCEYESYLRHGPAVDHASVTQPVVSHASVTQFDCEQFCQQQFNIDEASDTDACVANGGIRLTCLQNATAANLGKRCTFEGQTLIEPGASKSFEELHPAAVDKCASQGPGYQCLPAANCDKGTEKTDTDLCPTSKINICCKGSLLSPEIQRDITGLNKVGTTSLPTLIGKLTTVAMGILGSLALIMFLYGGVMWMTARGNADQIGTAVKTMIWASLGLAVIFASYAVVTFIFGTFK